MSATTRHHVDVVRELLGTHLCRDLGPDDDATPLAALGLESFTALAVRRDLRLRTGRVVPLVALLGGAHARRPRR